MRVEAQPGEVEGELDAEVVLDVVDGLELDALGDRGPLVVEQLAFGAFLVKVALEGDVGFGEPTRRPLTSCRG